MTGIEISSEELLKIAKSDKELLDKIEELMKKITIGVEKLTPEENELIDSLFSSKTSELNEKMDLILEMVKREEEKKKYLDDMSFRYDGECKDFSKRYSKNTNSKKARWRDIKKGNKGVNNV